MSKIVKLLVASIFLSLLLSSCESKYWFREFSDYTLRVFYVDGSTEILYVKNCVQEPRISSIRGAYYLELGNGNTKLGIDRFQVLAQTTVLRKKLVEPTHYFLTPNTNKWELVTSQDSINLNIAK